jgi:hypothetical protein
MFLNPEQWAPVPGTMAQISYTENAKYNKEIYRKPLLTVYCHCTLTEGLGTNSPPKLSSACWSLEQIIPALLPALKTVLIAGCPSQYNCYKTAATVLKPVQKLAAVPRALKVALKSLLLPSSGAWNTCSPSRTVPQSFCCLFPLGRASEQAHNSVVVLLLGCTLPHQPVTIYFQQPKLPGPLCLSCTFCTSSQDYPADLLLASFLA